LTMIGLLSRKRMGFSTWPVMAALAANEVVPETTSTHAAAHPSTTVFIFINGGKVELTGNGRQPRNHTQDNLSVAVRQACIRAVAASYRERPPHFAMVKTFPVTANSTGSHQSKSTPSRLVLAGLLRVFLAPLPALAQIVVPHAELNRKGFSLQFFLIPEAEQKSVVETFYATNKYKGVTAIAATHRYELQMRRHDGNGSRLVWERKFIVKNPVAISLEEEDRRLKESRIVIDGDVYRPPRILDVLHDEAAQTCVVVYQDYIFIRGDVVALTNSTPAHRLQRQANLICATTYLDPPSAISAARISLGKEPTSYSVTLNLTAGGSTNFVFSGTNWHTGLGPAPK
jgi:hypothetical protein